MENLRGLLGLGEWIKWHYTDKEDCGLTKGVGEKTDESVLQWLAIPKEWGMIKLVKGYV